MHVFFEFYDCVAVYRPRVQDVYMYILSSEMKAEFYLHGNQFLNFFFWSVHELVFSEVIMNLYFHL